MAQTQRAWENIFQIIKSYVDGEISKVDFVEATESAKGLMSADDKKNLNSLVTIVGIAEDDNTTVDKLRELLSIFENYPETSNLLEILSNKLDKTHRKYFSVAQGDYDSEYVEYSFDPDNLKLTVEYKDTTNNEHKKHYTAELSLDPRENIGFKWKNDNDMIVWLELEADGNITIATSEDDGAHWDDTSLYTYKDYEYDRDTELANITAALDSIFTEE